MGRIAVRLLSHSVKPVQTIWLVWASTRRKMYRPFFDHFGEQPDVFDVDYANEALGIIDLDKDFAEICRLDLPILEAAHFSWAFTNVPIEWREQAVRDRLWGWWFQSTIERGMENFFSDNDFSMPSETVLPDPESREIYLRCLAHIESSYRQLKERGVHIEQMRKIIPQAALHDGYGFANLRALMGLFRRRSCWFSKSELWETVLVQMIDQLEIVDPRLSHLITPPCMRLMSDKRTECKYSLMNRERADVGTNAGAPCPLWCAHEGQVKWPGPNASKVVVDDASRLMGTWEKLWGRDLRTGKMKKS